MERPTAVPVIFAWGLAAIFATGLDWTGHDMSRLHMSSLAIGHEPWRLLTSTLLHGDVLHLGFNLLWGWRFGSFLEPRLGHLLKPSDEQYRKWCARSEAHFADAADWRGDDAVAVQAYEVAPEAEENATWRRRLEAARARLREPQPTP